jgi:hypothetical protein
MTRQRRAGKRGRQITRSLSTSKADMSPRELCEDAASIGIIGHRNMDTTLMPERAISTFSKYTNVRTIAGRIASYMDEHLIDREVVHAVFQAMRSDRCSEQAARLLCDRFLSDYSSLRERHGGAPTTRHEWERFLSETVHYVRQAGGGRVRWRNASHAGLNA